MSQDHESNPAFPNAPDALYPGISARLWVATHLLAGSMPRITNDPDSPSDADFEDARANALLQADLLIKECNL